MDKAFGPENIAKFRRDSLEDKRQSNQLAKMITSTLLFNGARNSQESGAAWSVNCIAASTSVLFPFTQPFQGLTTCYKTWSSAVRTRPMESRFIEAFRCLGRSGGFPPRSIPSEAKAFWCHNAILARPWLSRSFHPKATDTYASNVC